MGIKRGYKKHCIGCGAYGWMIMTISEGPETSCRMHPKARKECPCGNCLVKIVCDKYCDKFYEIQIKEKGIIL